MSNYLLPVLVRALALGAVLSSMTGLTQSPETPKTGDSTPVLTAAEMVEQTISCKPSKITPGLLPKGTVVPIRVSVNEEGKIVGLTPVGRCPVGCGLLAKPIESIKKCRFRPYNVNGHTTAYQGDVDLVAP
jgi:hypothetical protein